MIFALAATAKRARLLPGDSSGLSLARRARACHKEECLGGKVLSNFGLARLELVFNCSQLAELNVEKSGQV